MTDNKGMFDRALLQGHYNKRPKNEINKTSELYEYYLTGMGLKLRAHPLAITIANEHFDHLNDFLKIRNEYATRITEALKKYPFLKLPTMTNNVVKSWYAYGFQYLEEKAHGVTKEKFVEALHAEGLVEVDIPGSTGLVNNLPLFTSPDKILGRLYPDALPPQKNFHVVKQYARRFVKIPVWSFPDEAEIVDRYIAGFEKVCDFILENKGL